MKTKKTAAKKAAEKKPRSMTPSAWPKREIVRTVKAGKGRNGNPVQFVHLECGHKRKVDMAARTHMRCRPCFKGGPVKPVKKAAKKITAKAPVVETVKKAA